MPSLESANIRRSIVRDSVPNVSIQQERQDWEAHAATLALPDGITSREELLAGVRCLWVEQEGRPLPAAAFFISGHFDMTLSGESLTTHCEVDPFTSRESLQRACDWYTSGADRHLPLVSPAFAALHALPPLLLQVGSDEMLLSDSLRVAERVRSHGGHVELRVWDGMWHNWPMYVDLPEADAAIAEAADVLERFATR